MTWRGITREQRAALARLVAEAREASELASKARARRDALARKLHLKSSAAGEAAQAAERRRVEARALRLAATGRRGPGRPPAAKGKNDD